MQRGSTSATGLVSLTKSDPTKSLTPLSLSTQSLKTSKSKSSTKSLASTSNTKVKVERTTSKTGDAKEKIKISAKVNEEELKKGQKSQVNCGLYFILQILALVTLILMVIWFIENFGGLSLKMTEEHMEQFFNLHPLFMVFGLVYVVANCMCILNIQKPSSTPLQRILN